MDMNCNYHPFIKALPAWEKGTEEEKNITLGLYCAFESAGKKTVLRVATSGIYRVYLNGEFFYGGPARAAHGYYRVDEVELCPENGTNHLAIEVVNYFVNSFDTLQQPGFIMGELVCGNTVAAATGADGFSWHRLSERIRKIQRYSYQRGFAEAYRLTPDCHNWRVGGESSTAAATEAEITEEKQLIPRRLKLYTYPVTVPDELVAFGKVQFDVIPEEYFKDRSLVHIKDRWCGLLDGYYENELEMHLTDEIQEMKNITFERKKEPFTGELRLAHGEMNMLSFPCEKTGILTLDVDCKKAGTLYLLFDELTLEDGDIDPLRLYCCNVVRLDLEEGRYSFDTVNPIGFKYLKLICRDGEMTVSHVGMRELICPQPITAEYEGSDPELRKLFDGARESFLQNCADLYMDCPTRERAGWLCDSYFAAKAEWDLTGENTVETNFLENYMLPESFRDMPEGMVPMCYPADHLNGQYIPNWALWLILEIEDAYFNRRGGEDFKNACRDRIMGILGWFRDYENADGLLEKIPGWVFVEWSMCNQFVQDINFPTNMLYYRAILAAANLYCDGELRDKAEKLRKVIIERSYNGTFFCDHEVYRDGVPVVTEECTETCQYYAFYMGIAGPETFPALWRTMTEEFGPDREEKGIYPEMYPSNTFMGIVMRLLLLNDNGYCQKVLDEVKAYFGGMAEKTGTLWEHTKSIASCNHGFTSLVAYLIRSAENNLRKNG